MLRAPKVFTWKHWEIQCVEIFYTLICRSNFYREYKCTQTTPPNYFSKLNTKFRFNNNLMFITFDVTQYFVFVFDLCILFFGSTPRIYISRHFYAYPHMVQLFLLFEYTCNDFTHQVTCTYPIM